MLIGWGQLWGGKLLKDVREQTLSFFRIMPIFCEFRVRTADCGPQFGSVSGHHILNYSAVNQIKSSTRVLAVSWPAHPHASRGSAICKAPLPREVASRAVPLQASILLILKSEGYVDHRG